jgi:TPP-dependent pyruvate/acetoin dehydrogenase alpha subunit
MANAFGPRNLYLQLRRRRFREPASLFDVRYWTPRELLDAFAAHLLDKEVLERSDIEKIVANYRTEVAKAEIAAKSQNGTSAPAPVAAAERYEPPQQDTSQ